MLPGAIASVFVLALCSNTANVILAVCVKHVNRVQMYIMCTLLHK